MRVCFLACKASRFSGQNESVFVVFVKGLEFYGYHGVSQEEQAVGHRYRANITLQVEGKADETDDIADTVDYGAVADLALRIASAKQYKTVEKLAAVLAEQLLVAFGSVQECEVEVAKLLPPMPAIAAEAGAVVKRTRG
jgi:dihydroneopterin aldolase